MNTVITSDQARKITGGRKPLTIVPFETACQALRECLEFDDVKYWDDLGDAYEAWAKIHRNDVVLRLARALKLKAAERIGQIALHLRPKRTVLERKANGGQLQSIGGANDLLIKRGFPPSHARSALVLAKHPERVIAALDSQKVPSPAALRKSIECGGEWSQFCSGSMWGVVCARMREKNPVDMARAAIRDSRNIENIKAQVTTMIEWLDEFDRHLKK